MEINTLVILGLLGAALCWLLIIHIKEERLSIKKFVEDEKDRLERAERIKRLTGKL
jgi:hypothetical protein